MHYNMQVFENINVHGGQPGTMEKSPIIERNCNRQFIALKSDISFYIFKQFLSYFCL